MNIRILLCLVFGSLSIIAIGQQTGAGMQYQAIARDLDGAPMANQEMTIKIEMLSVDREEEVLYEEFHDARSNQFGLLNLTIGTGEITFGKFQEIPWSDQNIWTRISIKNIDDSDFRIVTTNKLYSVPYAYYAQQAGELSDGSRGGGGDDEFDDSPLYGSTWSLKGNVLAHKFHAPPVMGTADNNPVVFITNDVERMRLTEEGLVEMKGDLNILGSTVIETDLTVFQNVYLNSKEGVTEIHGPTTIGGPERNPGTFTGDVQMDKTLDVDGATNLKSTLNVDGVTDLNNNLNVNNESASHLSGVLAVDGATNLNSTLEVEEATNLNSTLEVDEATILNSTLQVEGISDLNSALKVNNTSPTNLTGTLGVDGITDLNNALNVNNSSVTNLSGALNVDGATDLKSTLKVDGITNLNSALNVNNGSPTNLSGSLAVDGPMTLSGKVTFDINVTGDQKEQASYPVLIKGSKQGLAIDLVPAVNSDLQSHRGNNYISFWRDGQQKGRIEGMGRADLDPTGLVSLLVGMINSPPPALTAKGVDYNPFSYGNPTNISSLLSFGKGALPTFQNNITFNRGGLPSIDFAKLKFNPGSLPSLHNSLPFTPGSLPSLGFGSIESLVGFTNPFTDNSYSTFNGFINTYNGENTASPANAIWTTIKSSLMSSGMYPADPTNFESQIFSNYTLDILLQGISTTKAAIDFATAPASVLDPEDIFEAGVDLLVEITALTIYGAYADLNLGVAYESGAGDYAEWLLRADAEEMIRQGDIVGVIGGKVSKEFTHADRFMVVSTSPFLLGNMPENIQEEQLSEKIAFMGQVPVKVQGMVNVGDYILPSGAGDGLGIAIAPDQMLARDYQRIVGVAWEKGDPTKFINLINTAVGINHNDLSNVMEQMQFTLNRMQASLAKLDPSYEVHEYEVSPQMNTAKTLDYNVSATHKNNVSSYFKGKTYSNNEEVLADVQSALLTQAGIDVNEVPIMKHIFEHPEDAGKMATQFEGILAEMITMKEEMGKSFEK